LTKVPLIYSVSYFNLGGLKALLGGLIPPKLSPQGTGDETVCGPCHHSSFSLLQLSDHGDIIIKTKTVFGYLSVILAPFGTVFGYFG